MLRLFSILFVLGISATASALDATDAGTYALIHRDGHVTDFIFFVSLTGNTWNVEEKKPDGSWSSVTCEEDCILRESDQNDIARFFFFYGVLAKVAPSCVHNTAFAFCAYTPRAHPETKSHVLMILITPQPTPLRLKKLSNDRYAP